MEKTKLTLSLQCPDHETIFGMLNMDLNAKKIGYCYECIAENRTDAATILQTLKTVTEYLKESSSFYEKCRQRVPQTCGELPAEYSEELSKKGERLEKLSKHIDEEKDKVKKSFEEIRKIVLKIIDEKEKECLGLLDKEVLDLSEVYTKYEKLLIMGWPKSSDIPNIYPDMDTLRRRISKIETIDQLRTFMKGIQQDNEIQNLYFKDESQIKQGADRLIRCLNIPESSFPRISSKIMDLERMESLTRDFMEKLIQKGNQVENSIVSRINQSRYESSIISDLQFEILKDWLPKGYTFDLKLLYRGSVDGMSAKMFYEKCGNKGATITLVKSQFDITIGGFLDKSWNSDNKWCSSKEAFLFSLKGENSSVKCPILESQYEHAFLGAYQYGVIFGNGYDLFIRNDFKTGSVAPKAYSNASALCNGNETEFNIEEIEVFQVN